MKFAAIIMCLTLTILTACGSSDEGSAEAEDKETVFDPMVETIDKAAEVEDLLMQQKADMDEALRRAEGEVDDADP
jgi:hypothetical protein